MPRKKSKKITFKRSPTKSQQNLDKDSLNYMRNWLEGVKESLTKKEFEYDNEIEEIIEDDDSGDESECNLKELEKPIKQLLRRHPSSSIKKRFGIECEWKKCNFETNDERTYTNHVHDHILNLQPDENSKFKCLWNLCKHHSDSKLELLTHLDYHAYHTRLKTFGLGLASIISIPICRHDSKFRNEIPQISGDYFCNWAKCIETFKKFDEFVEHVRGHILFDYETGCAPFRFKRPNLKEIRVKCKWDDCGFECPNIFQLRRHVKTHTREKMIGCANCGTLFSTKKLFIEHCMRQVVNQRSFQCPDCLKSYPSTQLLRDHRKSHVNKFKCNVCGLSCQKKSVLVRHIRYRHMSEKPFACEQCDYKCKTKNDLTAHQNTHKGNEHLYKCEYCNYTSKTPMPFKKHYAKEHLGQPKTYQCHCCERQFSRGNNLSRHLVKMHQFKLAPGHSRFIYKEDLDGFFRLQTKRVEDLRDNSELMNVDIKEQDSNMDISYQIDSIPIDMTSPINIQVKKISVPKEKSPGTFKASLIDESTEDSKDINDFAIVKKYKKIIKQKKKVEN